MIESYPHRAFHRLCALRYDWFRDWLLICATKCSEKFHVGAVVSGEWLELVTPTNRSLKPFEFAERLLSRARLEHGVNRDAGDA